MVVCMRCQLIGARLTGDAARTLSTLTGGVVEPRPDHAVWFDLTWHGSKIVSERQLAEGELLAACDRCGGAVYVVPYRSE